VNIEGTTIHSFAGIGFGQEDRGTLLRKVGIAAKERWSNARVLVIDESEWPSLQFDAGSPDGALLVSMVDGKLFDTLEYLARKLRGNNAPFGDVQLVICGDFFQLPPVAKHGDSMTFTFDAFTWRKCIHKQVTLTKVFRQKESGQQALFFPMASLSTHKDQISSQSSTNYGLVKSVKPLPGSSCRYRDRYNTMMVSSQLQCTHLQRKPWGSDMITSFSRRAEVDRANQERLRQLPGEEVSYRALDYPGYDSKGHPTAHQRMVQLLDQTRAVPLLTLRVGAQVMLTKVSSQYSIPKSN